MNLMYLYIFFQSNLLEIPVYWIFFRKSYSVSKVVIFTTLVNSLTHPIVFFILMGLHRSYLNNIILAELFAIIVETLFFSRIIKISFMKSLFASIFANIVSWQIAPILTYIVFK